MNSGILFHNVKYLTSALNNFSKYLKRSALPHELMQRFLGKELRSFVVLSKDKLNTQVQLWKKYLPYISPYYAVKSNNDPILMSWMEGMFDKRAMGFDCASMDEITTVRKITKLAPILYAQPCKTSQDINNCVRHGIRATVVDSPEEMSKLANASWKSDVLIRLIVPDSNSKQPFSRKFGAPLEWIPEIMNIAIKGKISVSGFSFHVGSECENPDQFSKALQVCRLAMDQAVFACNYDARKLDTIDIGGGFLPTESNISRVSQVLEQSREQYFPEATSHNIKWIAEPGRFMSAPCQTLYTPVIGRKRGLPSDDPNAPEYRYTLHESVYGYF